MFSPATKTQSRLRLAISGPSGSGKTYSSLLIASGLGDKIAVVDTEAGSASLYSDIASFDVTILKPPFSVDRYISCIEQAEAGGYQVLVIDSLSHAWIGEGGLLALHDKITKSTGNSFGAWAQVTPVYNKLVEKIHQCNLHLICCLRAKSHYLIEEGKSGKKTPRKVGLEPEFRPGGLYEFDICLHLNETVATVSKDRSGQLESYLTPSIETGKSLSKWLRCNTQNNKQSNVTHLSQVTPEQSSGKAGKNDSEEDLSVLMTEVLSSMRELGLSDKLQAYESYLKNRFKHGLRDLTAEELNQQLSSLKKCKDDSALFEKFKGCLESLSTQAAA